MLYACSMLTKHTPSVTRKSISKGYAFSVLHLREFAKSQINLQSRKRCDFQPFCILPSPIFFSVNNSVLARHSRSLPPVLAPLRAHVVVKWSPPPVRMCAPTSSLGKGLRRPFVCVLATRWKESLEGHSISSY